MGERYVIKNRGRSISWDEHLILPLPGQETILEFAFWVCGTNPSPVEQK
jgi:hypothetical protein